MFDDQPQTKGGVSAPSNLPVSQPEDIFSSMPEALGEQPPSSALSAGALKPRLVPPPVEAEVEARAIIPEEEHPPVSVAPPVVSEEVTPARGPVVSRAIMIAVVLIISLGVLVFGVWYAYRLFSRSAVAPVQLSLAPSQTAPSASSQSIQPQPAQPSSTAPFGLQSTTTQAGGPSMDQKVLFGGPVDSDGDGLSDYDEIHIYHTDPHNWDTDGDGLSDYDEVMIWHTDPLNPDTDHDGYSDGIEVKNGYNPNGPGRLVLPPSKK